MTSVITGASGLFAMNSSFPSEALGLLACPADGGRLGFSGDGGERLVDERILCSECGQSYLLKDGILDLCGDAPSIPCESEYELNMRERCDGASRGDPSFVLSWADEIEYAATLKCLGDVNRKKILEVGCGRGFFTRQLAKSHATIVAVDLSMELLRRNAEQLPHGSNVAFVRADVSRLKLEPSSFDMALSTLYSNLPTEEIRLAANQAIHGALKPGGRYVLSAHHQHLRRTLCGRPYADHYEGSGIFYQNFSCNSLRRELRHDFTKIEMALICNWIPLISKWGRTRALISELCGSLPGANRLALLLLATATK
jgi:ubiquinone/menaquinone biosynthesis C-methylase UbiE/uncharacterized protein YbaR (Trm112 family)